MILDDQFEDFANQIAAQGYDHKTAVKYASLIGDTPLLDEKTGKWLVIQNDIIIARIDPV